MRQGQGLEGKGWRGLKNKEGKEEPWKRGKKGMNNEEGKEGSWKRGKQGMKNKDGEEEPWKRGKAKSEKREGEMINHPFPPSLPWFLLFLFIVHLFLPSLP